MKENLLLLKDSLEHWKIKIYKYMTIHVISDLNEE